MHTYSHPRLFLVPAGLPPPAPALQNPNPGRGTNTGTSPVGPALSFVETRVSIVMSNLVAWVRWPRIFGASRCIVDFPSASYGPDTWATSPREHGSPCLLGFAVSTAPTGAGTRGREPVGFALGSAALVPPSGGTRRCTGFVPHLCGLSTACFCPPLSPLTGADRFLGVTRW